MLIVRSKDIPDNNESTFVAVRASPGRFYLSRATEGKILYNISGEISLNVERRGDLEVATGKMILIPPSCSFSIYVRGESSFYLYRICVASHFTESSIPLQWLNDHESGAQTTACSQLDAHKKVVSFFDSLGEYIRDGISAHLLYTLKARELLLLMKNYYQPHELASFFSPITGRDHEFSDFVMKNYRNHRTVQQLAEASCHSLSSFNRLFRKNFGCAPYAWINRQRANDIYYDLTVTNIPVKEICTNHGFGSLPQFTTFCKRHFGASPRQLRELHGQLSVEDHRN